MPRLHILCVLLLVTLAQATCCLGCGIQACLVFDTPSCSVLSEGMTLHLMYISISCQHMLLLLVACCCADTHTWGPDAKWGEHEVDYVLFIRWVQQAQLSKRSVHAGLWATCGSVGLVSHFTSEYPGSYSDARQSGHHNAFTIPRRRHRVHVDVHCLGHILPHPRPFACISVYHPPSYLHALHPSPSLRQGPWHHTCSPTRGCAAPCELSSTALDQSQS